MLKEFFSLVYPAYCLACMEALEGGEEIICIHCRFDLPKTNLHLQPENKLEKRFWGKVQIRYAFAYLYFLKQSKVQELIHNLKYKGYQQVGELLGKWYGYELSESGFKKEFDLIIPIPLHKNRLKKRGYNQVSAFAQSLAINLEAEYCDKAVSRVTATSSQTRKSRFGRWKNVDEIFVANDKEVIKEQRILLVDDVITTGATLESCALELIKAGAKEVSIACIAMAE